MQADALMDLAEVLRLGARPGEAIEAAGQALALYEQKGNLVGVAAARRAVDGLGVGGQPVAS
jgi:hypothetical protein